jgi:hypothetical protein
VRAFAIVGRHRIPQTIESSIDQGVARIREYASPSTPSFDQMREDISTMYTALGLHLA